MSGLDRCFIWAEYHGRSLETTVWAVRPPSVMVKILRERKEKEKVVRAGVGASLYFLWSAVCCWLSIQTHSELRLPLVFMGNSSLDWFSSLMTLVKIAFFSPPQQARFNLAGLCLYSDGWHEDDASSQCRSWQIVFFEIVLLSCENICNLSFHHGWETRARMTPLCSVCRWTTFPPSPYVIVHVILSDGGDKCSVSSMFLHAFRICFFNLLRGSSRARAAEHGWLCELWDASLEERLKAVEHSYSKNSSLCRAVQQRSAPDAYRI